MVSKECLEGKFSIFNLFKCINYSRNFYRSNPNYFDPDGLTIFVGPQGSGKTLSAVKYVLSLKRLYPNSKIVTNIELTDYPTVYLSDFINSHIAEYDYHYEVGMDEDTKIQIQQEILETLTERYYKENTCFPFKNADDLSRYSNDKLGVIFLIDEIQLYFNSLNSKNIDPQVMVQISQQRKQRKHIVATSQVFGRMAKPLREQFSCVILCKSFFRYIQKNSLLDRDSMSSDDSTGTNLTGQIKKNFWWIHSPLDYQKYDTYTLIQNDFKDSKGVDIYDSTGLSSSS